MLILVTNIQCQNNEPLSIFSGGFVTGAQRNVVGGLWVWADPEHHLPRYNIGGLCRPRSLKLIFDARLLNLIKVMRKIHIFHEYRTFLGPKKL